MDDADLLFERLYELREDKTGEALNSFFKPLDNRGEDKTYNIQALKGYGLRNIPFLRIYAVRYGNSFVITGGAIKLTYQMKERPYTKLELQKLEWVKKYLGEDNNPEFVYLNIDPL